MIFMLVVTLQGMPEILCPVALLTSSVGLYEDVTTLNVGKVICSTFMKIIPQVDST